MIQDDMANSFIRLMPVREAAERLGISYPTIKQWIYKGSIRTVRTEGGHHRVPETEIDRLIARRSSDDPGRAGGGLRPPAGRRARGGTIVALSGRNQLRGTVEEVRTDGLLAQVRLRIADQVLTAVITRDAIDELKLRRGDTALAIVKATEVMIGREEEQD
jgi:molybdopterin-binding protein